MTKFNLVNSSVRRPLDGGSGTNKTVTATIVIAGFFLVGALLFAVNGNLSVSDVAH